MHWLQQKTPLGIMTLAFSEKGIRGLIFTDTAAQGLTEITAQQKQPLTPSHNKTHAKLAQQLALFMEGKTARLPHYVLDIDTQGTALQRSVWGALQKIPAGHTQHYTQLAKAIGRPKAARAVANACGANRVSLLIPCHRVVRSDGSLGGYRWGLPRKIQLLGLEKAHLPHHS